MQVPRGTGTFWYHRSDRCEVPGQKPPAAAALPFQPVTRSLPIAQGTLCFVPAFTSQNGRAGKGSRRKGEGSADESPGQSPPPSLPCEGLRPAARPQPVVHSAVQRSPNQLRREMLPVFLDLCCCKGQKKKKRENKTNRAKQSVTRVPAQQRSDPTCVPRPPTGSQPGAFTFDLDLRITTQGHGPRTNAAQQGSPLTPSTFPCTARLAFLEKRFYAPNASNPGPRLCPR